MRAHNMTLRWLAVKAATLALLTLGLTVAAPAAARAETWQIDPVHSSIGFSVRHLMISNVKGQFEKFSGKISSNGNDPASVKIEADIDATSIDTRSADRDKDLKSDHFLEVAKYPAITFRSTKIEPAGEGKWKVSGDLTIRGVTKPITLDMDGPTAETKDPWGNTRRGASASTTISRKDFGLTWNKTLESGGVVVGDEVAISIEVEAIKKAD